MIAEVVPLPIAYKDSEQNTESVKTEVKTIRFYMHCRNGPDLARFIIAADDDNNGSVRWERGLSQ